MSCSTDKLQHILALLSELIEGDLTPQEVRSLTIPIDYSSELDKLGIIYEPIKSANEVKIDLDQEDFYIRKTKQDFLKTCHNHVDISSSTHDLLFKKPILILEQELIYQISHANENPIFFKNVLLSFEALNIFKNIIADFDDVNRQEVILLSSSKGKTVISYDSTNRYKFQNFFDDDSGDFIANHTELVKKAHDDSFILFLKDSIISADKYCFFEILSNMSNILNSANRNLELYKKKFDFEEFEKGLTESKQDFFNSYTKFQSEILSKINSLPIQFGIYIYLLNRFSDQLYPLAAISLLILIWGGFYIATLINIENDLGYLEEDFKSTFHRILHKSGLADEDLDNYRKQILTNSRKQIKRISRYKWLNIFLLSFLFFISCYLIYCLI